MSTKRIEQLIEEIFEFVESCKPSAFSSSKVIVPKEELYDLLDELRLKVPEEIKRCQKMIANRDAIMAKAEDEAARIEQTARQQAQRLVEENEIMQQAYYQANGMVRQATEQAESMLQQAEQEAMRIGQGALGYTNDMLSEVEKELTSAYENIKKCSDEMLGVLSRKLETIAANRGELAESTAPQETEPVNQAAGAQEEDFDFDENIFLDNVDNEE